MATKKTPAAKKAPSRKSAKKLTIPKEIKDSGPKLGRPTSYKEGYAELAYKFCLLGATDKKLAEMFDVAISTIYLWKEKVPAFSEAVMRGRHIADGEVAKSLYLRAVGYEHPEDDIRTVALGNNMGSEIQITPTVKRYPPDTAAATLWLKNRQPDLWRDKTEQVLQNPDGTPIDMSLKVTFVTPKQK